MQRLSLSPCMRPRRSRTPSGTRRRRYHTTRRWRCSSARQTLLPVIPIRRATEDQNETIVVDTPEEITGAVEALDIQAVDGALVETVQITDTAAAITEAEMIIQAAVEANIGIEKHPTETRREAKIIQDLGRRGVTPIQKLAGIEINTEVDPGRRWNLLGSNIRGWNRKNRER
jgi:hypothetical protein